MPRTVNNLWNDIVNFENFLRAFRKVCKKGKSSRYEAMVYKERLDENIIDLINSLTWRMWVPGPFTCHYVFEPKKRYVEAPCFADRVLQEGICRILSPIFDKRFIANSFACRIGKGTLRCSLTVRDMLKDAQRHSHGRRLYFLKADISKYYPSINHCKLWKQIERTIADKNVLWLLHEIIFNSGYEEVGIPIGSQTSQLFANIYLSPLDHFMKTDLHMKYYARYMDDVVAIDYDKRRLKDVKKEIGVWLHDNLNLRLNPKTSIAPVSQGIDFSGYRHWPTHVRPRKKNVKKQRANFKRLSRLYREGKTSLEHVRNVVTSFTGYMQHCNGYRTAESTLKNLVLRRPS